MKRLRGSAILVLLTLFALILAACSPGAVPDPGDSGVVQAPAESSPGEAPAEPEANQAELENPQPAEPVVVREDLEATDPATVELAAGQPQIVEFFAFW